MLIVPVLLGLELLLGRKVTLSFQSLYMCWPICPFHLLNNYRITLSCFMFVAGQPLADMHPHEMHVVCATCISFHWGRCFFRRLLCKLFRRQPVLWQMCWLPSAMGSWVPCVFFPLFFLHATASPQEY